MEQQFDLTSVTLLATLALVCGLALHWLRLPAVIGYIVAGIVLGPSGWGLVQGTQAINLFAELGVLLLLFLLGMEVSLRAFKSVLGTVLLCALLQAAVALTVTAIVSYLMSWPFEQAIVLGFVLALSSTAVGVKILEDIGEIRTEVGRITIGVLIAQDLLIVPMLVVVNSLGGELPIGWGLAVRLLVSIAVLAGVIGFLSRRTRLRLPLSKVLRRNRDIGTLATLVFCFVAATATGFLGLSGSYGAFIAGQLIGTASWHANGDDGQVARFSSVFVHPMFARHGLGRRLIAEVEARAFQSGFHQLGTSATPNAVPFFERLGYHVASRGIKTYGPPRCALPVAFLRKSLPRLGPADHKPAA